MIGILAIWNDCAVGRTEAYEGWYHGEHLADRVSVPGFRFGRRHEAITGSPDYFTYYETDSVDVLFSEQYLKQLDNPSPVTKEVMDGTFINATRTVCERTTCVGAGRGGYLVAGRTRTNMTEIDWYSRLSDLLSESGVLGFELWRQAVIPESKTSARAEEQIRGADVTIMDALIVHTAREKDARMVYDVVRQDHEGQVGIYRLVSELNHEDLHRKAT